uniref:Uncharacterized protein n=1 Tax=viral metagenome TaxID=1070528 RepID=A0A6M3Y0C5_9ZZZZ
MNNAERTLEYYESKDFEGMHYNILFEFYLEDKSNILDRIKNIVDLELDIELNSNQAKEIYNYVENNFEEHITHFCSYYVGDNSLESVSFGEQEEQIEPGEAEIYSTAGFYVNKEKTSAYRDMSSEGIHIQLNLTKIKQLYEAKK